MKGHIHMVYTVTFNPALDYVLKLDKLTKGTIQRSTSEDYHVGGKGINVSNVLTQLGIDNVAMGFVAGFVGDEIGRGIGKLGVRSDFIRLNEGNSRINVKIRSDYDLHNKFVETDINASGCDIGKEYLDEFFLRLDKITDGDYIVLSGSIPESVPQDIYESILKRLSVKNVNCVIDTGGGLLKNTLGFRPFLIKPNIDELCELFEIKPCVMNFQDDVKPYVRMLGDAGARNVLVSMGAAGAILLTEDGEFMSAPTVTGSPVSSVGAGDSMVAGFLAGWIRHGDYKEALLLGTAAGAATAFCEGMAGKEEILGIYGTLGMD